MGGERKLPAQGCADDSVMFIDDVAAVLRVSRATIERRRKVKAFPIAEMPTIDSRPRWSRKAVEKFIGSTAAAGRTLRRAA